MGHRLKLDAICPNCGNTIQVRPRERETDHAEDCPFRGKIDARATAASDIDFRVPLRLRDAIAAAMDDARRHAENCRLSHEGDERQPFIVLVAAFRSAMNDAIELRDHEHLWQEESGLCSICGADGNA